MLVLMNDILFLYWWRISFRIHFWVPDNTRDRFLICYANERYEERLVNARCLEILPFNSKNNSIVKKKLFGDKQKQQRYIIIHLNKQIRLAEKKTFKNIYCSPQFTFVGTSNHRHRGPVVQMVSVRIEYIFRFV